MKITCALLLFASGAADRSLAQVTQITQVCIENNGTAATATVLQKVTLGDDRKYALNVAPEHHDEILKSLQLPPKWRVAKCMPATGDQLLRDAFRLDFDSMRDAEIGRRLQKLVGAKIRVVQSAGKPQESEGTLDKVEATQITLKGGKPILLGSIDEITLADMSPPSACLREIAIEGPPAADKEAPLPAGHIAYQFSCTPWSVQYRIFKPTNDPNGGRFEALAVVDNPTPVAWLKTEITLRSGSISYSLFASGLGERQTETFVIEPKTSEFPGWHPSVEDFADLLFDAGIQSSGDAPFEATRLAIPRSLRPWLIDGPVAVSIDNTTLFLPKLPAPDDRIVSPPAQGKASDDVRYFRLRPSPKVSVRFDVRKNVYAEIVRLTGQELTLRLGDVTTYQADYRPGANSTIHVSLGDRPGMTLKQKSLSLTPLGKQQEAWAVRDAETTINVRLAKPADLRELAKRDPKQPESQQLNDIADELER